MTSPLRSFEEYQDATRANLACIDATLERIAAEPLLKPTCDEAGNWLYVPAVQIDGPRVPVIGVKAARVYARKVHERMAEEAYEFNASRRAEGGLGIVTHDDAARAAVEGGKLGEVA